MSGAIFGLDELTFNILFCLDTYLGRPRVNRLLEGVRRRNLERLLRRARSAREADEDLQRVGSIPVRLDLTPEAFRDVFLKASEPVVMKGIAKNFEAVGKWSPEFFRDRYGDMVVVTVDGQRRGIEDEEAGIAEIHTSEMTLAQQVDAMLKGKSDYVSFWTELFTQHPELTGDVDVDLLRGYVRPSRWASNPIFKFFMGAGGTTTQWHCAELQNFFVQISGTKEWLLCSPAWTPCFDPRIVTLSQQYCHSMIDFRDPQVDRYPLYPYAPMQRVVLEPGDVLYIPPFWWHCVTNPEVSIGLAVWWPNIIPAMRAHSALFWLTVLSPQHLLRWAREALQGEDRKTAVSTNTIFRAHSD